LLKINAEVGMGASGVNDMADDVEADKQLWDSHFALSNKITHALDREVAASGKPYDDVHLSLQILHKRVMLGVQSLRILRFNSPPDHEFAYDGGVLLRTIYEASLYATYILHEPTRRQALAERYLDFRFMRGRQIRRWADSSLTTVAKHVRESPLRCTGEPILDRNLSRIRKRYKTIKGWPDSWYKGQPSSSGKIINNLRDLAAALGFDDEYHVVYASLSSSSHASAASLLRDPIIGGKHLLTYAWHFAFRVLAAPVDYYGLDQNAIGLTDEEWGAFSLSRKSFFEIVPSKQKCAP